MTSVAVAVNGRIGGGGGSGSERAVRWAVKNLLPVADRFILLHVMPTITSIPTPSGVSIPIRDLDANLVEMYVKDMKIKLEAVFIPFKKLCKTKKMETLVLEGDNPAIALIRYISESGIRSLVLGSCSSNCVMRKLYGPGVPSSIMKYTSESCDIYVVFKQKLVTKMAMAISIRPINELTSSTHWMFHQGETSSSQQISQTDSSSMIADLFIQIDQSSISDAGNPHSESYTCKGSNASLNQEMDRQTSGLDHPIVNRCNSTSSTDIIQPNVHAEIEKLRLKLQDTVVMYKRACQDLAHTQNMVRSLSSKYLEDTRKMKTAQEREATLNKIAEEEKAKCLEAMKDVELARDLLAKEIYEGQIAEENAFQESLEKEKIISTVLTSDCRYRKYSTRDIEVATDLFSENKVIGVGGYGKVYKCNLDHTPVAVKVLNCAASSQKKEEFLKEIEVLTSLRHPNIVLLLGACPENHCLIYEYMENGSLEDHIFNHNGKPPLPWYTRFKIAFEVACGLAFLHNSKPEPIVHRDLKPGNILLDRNFVSKIGDVGLAKFIYNNIPDDITQYSESIIAGTLFYMDPEYHRTGTVRPKSDLYGLGVILLQLLTGRKPMGIILTIENTLKRGSFVEKLDSLVTDWPLGETEELAQIALKCCKDRCRDRPDLNTEVLPVLKKLADIAHACVKLENNNIYAPSHYFCPILQEIMEETYIAADGYTYEHRAILAWLKRHAVSPVTKLAMKHTDLTPNHVLRSAIQEWRSRVYFSPI